MLEKRLNKLSEKKQAIFWDRYDRKKLNTGSAWALWFFGFHYLHTGKIGLWFLYVISCFLYVGIARWIIQAVMLNDEIEKKNAQIQERILEELE